ncbi:MAG: efflux RND transporter periplasmic adaptor subunit [Bacteroidales bacterium]|nr:efflux RND transporter periplasmic adaptor subunit [Bacteroidales bacterium]MCF8333171.1 efflux RND transporter periplasmic adaptor subunit [Bacteroidales bacterium]
MNRTKNIIAGIAILALAGFLVYTVIIINQPEKHRLQGEIEAKEIKVSSKITGRIDSLPVIKGQEISKGQTLFTVGSPEIKAKLQQALAGKDIAKARDNKAGNGTRKEDIQAAYSDYQKAKAAEEFAEKTYKRIKNLYEDGVVPAHKLDKVKADMEAARKTTQAAKALWLKAKKGTRREDKEAAQAMVEKAKGAIAEVRSYLDETNIKAPHQGEIANIIAEQGELVPAGYPVITITDRSDSWATFHLKETYLESLRIGDVVKCEIPALDKTAEFKISYIHPTAEYATWNATKAEGTFDIKTFRVEARPLKEGKGLRPGMSVLMNESQIK